MSKKRSIPKSKFQTADIAHQLKRAMADYQNLQKRHATEKINYTKYANAVLLDKLLPVLDDLQRAQKHLKDKGLSLILEQLQQIFKSEGASSINALKQKFDPQTMDCIELVPGKKNIVIDVTQTGYTLHDKVLRPAKVKVGQGG